MTGSYDQTVKIWDLRSDINRMTLNNHNDKIFDGCWCGS